MRTADSWQQTGGRYERPPVAPRVSRPTPTDSPARDRGYSPPPVPSGHADREMERSADYRRSPARDAGRARPANAQRPSRRPEAQEVRSDRRPAAAPERGSRLRG